MNLSGHYEEEREEGNTDRQRRRENGLQEMSRTFDRSMPAGLSLANLLQIIINDDNRVVYDHTQRDDQRRQCNSIQLKPKRIEKSQRDKDRNRDGRGRYQGNPQRQ